MGLFVACIPHLFVGTTHIHTPPTLCSFLYIYTFADVSAIFALLLLNFFVRKHFYIFVCFIRPPMHIVQDSENAEPFFLCICMYIRKIAEEPSLCLVSSFGAKCA